MACSSVDRTDGQTHRERNRKRGLTEERMYTREILPLSFAFPFFDLFSHSLSVYGMYCIPPPSHTHARTLHKRIARENGSSREIVIYWCVEFGVVMRERKKERK